MKFRLLLLFVLAVSATAAGEGLPTGVRSALPAETQQIISLDQRTLRSSAAAAAARERLLPAYVRPFEQAMRSAGLDPEKDVNQLSFVLFRHKSGLRLAAFATGSFDSKSFAARQRQKRQLPRLYRTTEVFASAEGMQIAFLDATTMLIGDETSLRAVLDARDGRSRRLGAASPLPDSMKAVDAAPVWSVLDKEGANHVLRSGLGESAQVADYSAVKERLLGARYMADTRNDLSIELEVLTPDAMTAGTLAAAVKAGMLLRKLKAAQEERALLDSLVVQSQNGAVRIILRADERRLQAALDSDLVSSLSH